MYFFIGSTSKPKASSVVTPRIAGSLSSPKITAIPPFLPINSISAIPISLSISLPKA